MNKNIIYAAILTIVFLFYIIMDLILNDKMWKYSMELTVSMQEDNFFGEAFMYNFFTYIVFIPPVAALYCFLFTDNKLNSLLYFVIVAASVTSNELLKNIYHQPRPYMVEEQIKGLKCNPDFGKPSGHSQNSVVMMSMLPFLLFPGLLNLKRSIYTHIEDVDFRPRSKSGFTIESAPNYQGDEVGGFQIEKYQSTWLIVMKIITLIFLTASIFMTGFSRIYFGVHSLGQVILGWVFGIYLCLMYLLVIHQYLRKSCFKVMNSSPRDQYKYIIPFYILLLLGLMGIDIGLLQVNLHFLEDSQVQQWIKKINKCEGSQYTTSSPQILYNSCCQTAAAGAVITGLVIGAMLNGGNYSEGSFTRNYAFLNAKQKVLRIVILIGPLLILIPFLFINADSIYLITFIKILPLGFLTGLIINFVYPQLMRKLNISVKGDILSYEDQSLLSSEVKDNIQITLESRQLGKYGDENNF